MKTPAISAEMVERVGWVLLHSLWQFAALTLVVAVALRLLQRRSATVRYAILCLALLLTVMLPATTWMFLPGDARRDFRETATLDSAPRLESLVDADASRDPGTLPIPSSRFAERPHQELAHSLAADGRLAETPMEVAPSRRLASDGHRSWSERTAKWLRPWLNWIVAGWSIGVMFGSLRPLLGWQTLRRLRRVGVSPVSDDVQALLHQVSQRLGVHRAIRVLQSTVTQIPVVVGYVRPIILLPVSLVASVPATQLEAILAHELAHVRRHDFLVNLLQTFVETIFFYHPAVWWLSHQIRDERENCCDDLVVAVLGNRIAYSRALLAIEEHRGTGSVFAFGAADGQLLARVRRIVGVSVDRPVGSRWSAASALVMVVVMAGATSVLSWHSLAQSRDAAPLPPSDRVAEASEATDEPASVPAPVVPGEWPMWGGSPDRNHVASGRLPTEWDVKTGQNVLWTAKVGTQTYSSPVVAGGKLFIGTNNGAGLDPRRPSNQDLSCLVCLEQTTGKLLWQFASEKLPAGRAHDWPEIGLCSTACVAGDRLWVVTNRCEVVCLDTQGFRDGENDGPFTAEAERMETVADVVWKFDMFKTLGVRPLHQAVSSITVVDGIVLLNTSNGPDEDRRTVPAPDAPDFLALDAGTGQVAWQDNASGESVIVGGSSCSCSGTSPAVAKIGGVTQAIFAGREGWLYGFDFAGLKQGKTTRLWRFDCNPKTSKYVQGGPSGRNTLVGSPVVVGDYVFVATGRNPEEGEGHGDLWCIDATKRGDISSELVFNPSHRDGREPIPHKPFCACDPDQGDFTRPNPNSGAVWHYVGTDRNGDGKLAFDETFHRSISSPAIHDGLLFIPDFSGLLHCVDARTGAGLWTHDLLAAVWSSCLIADNQVVIGDEDGEIEIFQAARTCQPLYGDDPRHISTSIYSTPALVNGTLFLASKDLLVALREGGTDAAVEQERGAPADGLRARVVPVRSSMPENAIDPDQRVALFESPDEIAFVVELENVSDQPIQVFDLEHGSRNGRRVPHADWLSQFVFAVDRYDGEGQLIEQPDVYVDDIAQVMDGAHTVALEPGKIQRFLIRPNRWMTVLRPQFNAGHNRVAVRYLGLSARYAERIRQVRPDSPLLSAAAVKVVSAPVSFDLLRENRTGDLAWGEAIQGLRGAVSFASGKATHAHGERAAVNLHLQNVSEKPVKLVSKLSLPNALATIQNAKGETIELDALELLGRRWNGVIVLKPRQIAVLDAGHLGFALTRERADRFDARAPRRLVAPAGQYSLRLECRFGDIQRWEGGQDKVLVADAWIGELQTGFAPFEIANETTDAPRR